MGKLGFGYTIRKMIEPALVRRTVRRSVSNIKNMVESIKNCSSYQELSELKTMFDEQIDTVSKKMQSVCEYTHYGKIASWWMKDIVEEAYDNKINEFITMN